MSTTPPQRERLTTRILHPHDPAPSTEDIFAAALDTLFTDDTQQSHGVPGQSVIYRSPRFGDVYLRIPAHPDEDSGRRLFAHYLWNSGVVAAEGIERGSSGDDEDDGVWVDRGADGNELGSVHWDKRFWDVRGLDVLELGAATALPSLISALSNARTVVATDHSSSPAITSDAIRANVRINITERESARVDTDTGVAPQPSGREYVDSASTPPWLHHPPVSTTTRVSVLGYSWGTKEFYDPETPGVAGLVDEERRPRSGSFDRIVIADCLWMPEQHDNLIRTVDLFLRGQGDGQSQDRDQRTKERVRIPCALVVAGFHTGRNVVRDFVKAATGSVMGDGVSEGSTETNTTLRAIEIFEIDVDGGRRAWRPERPGESKEQSKRWCMCAVLVKR